MQMLMLHRLRIVRPNHRNDAASGGDHLPFRSGGRDLPHELWQIDKQRFGNLKARDLLLELPQVSTSVPGFDDLHGLRLQLIQNLVTNSDCDVRHHHRRNTHAHAFPLFCVGSDELKVIRE